MSNGKKPPYIPAVRFVSLEALTAIIQNLIPDADVYMGDKGTVQISTNLCRWDDDSIRPPDPDDPEW